MGPSTRHLLGTDNLGRDILVRTVYGARVSLLVGVVVGVVVGVLAGYSTVAVDTVLSRLMDVVLSFPFLLFAIALVSIVGPVPGRPRRESANVKATCRDRGECDRCGTCRDAAVRSCPQNFCDQSSATGR